VCNEGRALRVAYSFSDTLGISGIGAIAWHQIAGLVRQGAQVWVFTPRCARPVPGVVELRETLRFFGRRLPLRHVGPFRPRLFHDWLVARSLRGLRHQLDVVHCWPGCALRTLKTARQLSLATFLERPNTHTRFARDVVYREHERLGVPIPKCHSHAISDRRLAREEAEYALADRLLCPSAFVADTFLSMDFAPTRIARHQYGCDVAEFFPESTAPRRRAGPLQMVFVGRCEPRKGLHYALPAWLSSKASASGKFHICGTYVPGYRETLSRWLAHPSIVEHGFLKDVAGIMRDCDALILPSVEEGSALVTYEARACGCVLLVSNATGAPADHMRNSLVHGVGDVAGLRDQIDLLASDRQLLDTLRAASAAGLQELTWDHAATRLLNAYHEHLNAARGKPAPEWSCTPG
jgi:glycosyltransferase involved in cell wall biosynthesis